VGEGEAIGSGESAELFMLVIVIDLLPTSQDEAINNSAAKVADDSADNP
jgi:hypothetical protein